MPGPGPAIRPGILAVDTLCWRCTRRRLTAGGAGAPGQRFLALLSTTTARPTATSLTATRSSDRLRGAYFLSNTLLERFAGIQFKTTRRTRKVTTTTTSTTTTAGGAESSDASSQTRRQQNQPQEEASLPPTKTLNELAPHRRRQAAKRLASANAPPTGGNGTLHSAASTAAVPPQADDGPGSIPPDASSILANAAASQPANSLRRHLSALLSLSKPRLTILVVLTAMAPYALYPVPAFLSPALAAEAAAPSLSPLTLLFLTTGTALCSAAANALNMLYEPRTDALMSRTRGRPLVRRLVTTRAALLFAACCAAAGAAALYVGVNPTVAFLGAANIVLYAGVYTPLKRISAANTWVGAVVGGIPPLMGWAAAAGESAVGDGSWRELLAAPDGSSLGGWLFAAVLFAWQFPHFMALSWGVRDEYKAAGLRMLAWTDPARNGRVALRYGMLAFVPLCAGLCAAGVTEWSFAATSLPVNLWLARESVRFWRLGGAGGSARGLFWATVWHLPVVMVLALLQKKGMWARVWRSVVGDPAVDEEDDDQWEYDDDGEEDDDDDTNNSNSKAG